MAEPYLDTLTEFGSDLINYGIDVAKNIPGDALDLLEGAALAPIAVGIYGGKALFNLATDPIGSVEYIADGEMWDDFVKNIGIPFVKSYMEYSDPIEKFRKDPLFVVLDAMTLMNVGGTALSKIGKTLKISELAELGEIPISKRMGRSAINKFLKSNFAEVTGINSWTERIKLVGMGRSIRDEFSGKAFGESVADMKIIEEIGKNFSDEETVLFHTALKGFIHPELFNDYPNIGRAMDLYKKLSDKNISQLLKNNIINEDIINRRSILPSIEVMRRILKSEKIPESIPENSINQIKNIMSSLVGDRIPGADKVREALTQLHGKGMGVVDEFFTPEAVALLKNRGLPSGYISDIRPSVIRYSDFGIRDDVFTSSLTAPFKRAEGKRVLSVLDTFDDIEQLGNTLSKNELLNVIGKTQLSIARQINEKRAAETLISYGLKNTDKFGKPLARLLNTKEAIIEAISNQNLIVSPGKSHLNRLAVKLSRSIVGRLESGAEISASALSGINTLIESGELAASGLASAKGMYELSPSLGKSMAQFARPAGKFAKLVDTVNNTWKGIILGLNPRFAVNMIAEGMGTTILAGSEKGFLLHMERELRDVIPPEVTIGTLSKADIEWFREGKNFILPDAKPLGKLYDHLQDGMIKRGMGKIMNIFEGVDNVKNKIFNFTSKVEDYYREITYLDRIRKFEGKKLMKQVGRDFYNTEEFVSNIMRNGIGEDASKFAIQEVNKWFYNYNKMSQFEKTWIRRFVPFWGFVRHSLTLSAKAPFENPGRINALFNISRAIQQANEFEGAPDWIKNGGVVVGKSPFQSGKSLFISTRGMNPFGAIEELASLVTNRPGTGTPLQALSPLIKVPLEQFTGRQLFGQQKRFTSPFVYEDPFSGKLFYMDKHSGEISETGPVTPNIIEHFARQVPQYQLVKDMLYPFYRYGTSTLFTADPRYPRNEKPRELTALRSLIPVSQIDKLRYIKSYRKQLKMAQTVLMKRLGRRYATETPASAITTSIEEITNNFFGSQQGNLF